MQADGTFGPFYNIILYDIIVHVTYSLCWHEDELYMREPRVYLDPPTTCGPSNAFTFISVMRWIVKSRSSKILLSFTFTELILIWLYR